MYFVDFTNDYDITKKPIDELYFRQTNEKLYCACLQPKLGLAEIESLYGSSLINRVGLVFGAARRRPGKYKF